jgi:23S rRNA (cytidine2498-2'-O)-methyltransferase
MRLPIGIVVADTEIHVGRAIVGAGLQGVPMWPAGRPDLPYYEHLVSRSALKLIEAIELFGLEMKPGARALDFGAAPGGWSQVLAAHGLAVTSVDPGQLDPAVASLPGVSALACTAQSFLRQDHGQFDVIVNDMRVDARESARIMVDSAHVLRPTGVAVITLKLPRQAPTANLRQAITILRKAFSLVQARSLFFNRNEVTVLART